MKNAQILTIAFAGMLGCICTNRQAEAAEPEPVSVALLFDATAIEDGCLEGDIVIIFGGRAEGSSSTQKSLDGYDFGDFGNTNIHRVPAKYVTQGGVAHSVVWQIGDITVPDRGVMLLNNGGDFVIEFCGFVSESSNTLSADDSGDLALIIVTGLVR